MEKEKLLFRIFKEEAEEKRTDMNTFYHMRRKGYMPFLNPNGRIEWLKRKDFRIAAVRKIASVEKPGQTKHQKGSRRKKDSDLDFTGLSSPKIYKYFFFGVAATTIAYFFIKLMESVIGH